MMAKRRGKVRGGCCALALLGLVACVTGLILDDQAHLHGAPGDLSFGVLKVTPPPGTVRGVEIQEAHLVYPDAEDSVTIQEASWDPATDAGGPWLVLEVLMPDVGPRTSTVATLRVRGNFVLHGPPAWSPTAPPPDAGEDTAFDLDALVAILSEGGVDLPPGFAGECLRCGKPGRFHSGEDGLCMDCSDELVYGSDPIADTPRLLRAAIRAELAGGKHPDGLTGAGPWFVIDGQNAWARSLVPEMRDVLAGEGRTFTPGPRLDRSQSFSASTSARVDGMFDRVMEASIGIGLLVFLGFGVGAVALQRKS